MAKGLKLGNRRCACPTCGECFTSPHAFDRHRVPVAPDGARLPRGHRRCLESLEMLSYGMVENAAGYWTSGPNPRWGINPEPE